MGRSKLGSVRPKPDPIKGLILEAQKISGISDTKLAEIWGVSRATCSKRLNHQHSDLWLGDAKVLCRKLNIGIEDFRASVRY